MRRGFLASAAQEARRRVKIPLGIPSAHWVFFGLFGDPEKLHKIIPLYISTVHIIRDFLGKHWKRCNMFKLPWDTREVMLGSVSDEVAASWRTVYVEPGLFRLACPMGLGVGGSMRVFCIFILISPFFMKR